MGQFAPARFVVRDLAAVGLVLLMWTLSTRLAPLPAPWGWILDVVTGLATLYPAAALHEWGHLAGARLGRSVVRFPEGVVTKLLFDFDVDRNNPTQFLMMSFGGYAGNVVGIVVLWLVLPPDRLASWIAQIGAVIGLLVSVAIEFPHTWQVIRGGPLPRPLVTVATPTATSDETHHPLRWR